MTVTVAIPHHGETCRVIGTKTCFVIREGNVFLGSIVGSDYYRPPRITAVGGRNKPTKKHRATML